MTVFCADTTNCSDAYEVLASDVMPRLPGALQNVINNETKEVLREFFRASRVWTEDVGPFTVRANRNTVHLNPIRAGAIAFSAANVMIGRSRVYPWHIRSSSLLTKTTNSEPMFWNMLSPGELTLYPTPTKTYTRGLVCSATLRPDANSAFIPDFVLDTYRDILIDGLLGRMLSHSNKPYTDLTLAAMHTAAFKGAMSIPRREADAVGTQGREWVYPRFA